MNNPLFPPSNDPVEPPKQPDGYIMPRSTNQLPASSAGQDAAADVIRDKLAKLYAAEPTAQQVEREAVSAPVKSKHQQFMLDLNNSGKDLAQIQTEWHNYYVNLPDHEKHEVWQEFYASNAHAPQLGPASLQTDDTESLAALKTELAGQSPATAGHRRTADHRSPRTIRSSIRSKVTADGKIGAKQHLQSLLFGIGMAVIVLIIFLFGFFNEVIIAPFIQPSRNATATPLIVSADSIAPSATPEVIIPKINVEIPVDFSETSTNEATIENDLESGVVHYPTTSLPGQTGNAAFFGHSSNNIFNKGKYKFAFVLLHELVPGDTFYITNDGKVYVYKVFSKTIVDPSDVGVLNPVSGHADTATLITCDPPGTSLHRLVVVGDQISPNPSGNSASTTAATTASSTATELAGNGQTLWGRFISQPIGKVIVGLVIAGGLIYGFRRFSREPKRY